LLEFRLGVSLDQLGENWARELATLESSVNGTASQGAFAATAGEALVDYVYALSDFDQSYLEDNSIDTERYDSEILYLRPLASAGVDQLLSTDASYTPMVRPPIWTQMNFKCRDAQGLRQGGGGSVIWDELWGEWLLDTPPCDSLGGVEYALTSFDLPIPLRGYAAELLLNDGFNYRIETFALNLVNDEQRPLFDPNAGYDCRTSLTVKYDMARSGPAVLENFSGDVQWFDMDSIVAEGRAIATGQLLSNPPAPDGPDVTRFLRRELRGRPLGGRYTVKLEGNACMIWDRLDDVQIWLDYHYWRR
jgi:hypothetical protein